MPICIDSSVFVRGLHEPIHPAGQLLLTITSHATLVVPRLVAQEVTRNLTSPAQKKLFYLLFQDPHTARIIDEPIPVHIVQEYIARGLPEKADAFIGAFAEWQQVSHLISLNRHFLRGLDRIPFTVLDPNAYLQQLAI